MRRERRIKKEGWMVDYSFLWCLVAEVKYVEIMLMLIVPNQDARHTNMICKRIMKSKIRVKNRTVQFRDKSMID